MAQHGLQEGPKTAPSWAPKSVKNRFCIGPTSKSFLECILDHQQGPQSVPDMIKNHETVLACANKKKRYVVLSCFDKLTSRDRSDIPAAAE